jgi:phosphatidate cytidylyltransferase
MRQRALSSAGVVIIGLIPTIIGGPVFPTLMAGIGIVGFLEFLVFADRVAQTDAVPTPGYVTIAVLALAGWLGWRTPEVSFVFAFGVAAPLVALFRRAAEPGAFAAWSLVVAGTMYLGTPVLAATSLRAFDGAVASPWLDQLATASAPAWAANSRGLAWTLLVVLSIWIGDSASYLVGRAIGRTPLAPALSPRKTVEGSIAGLVGAAAAAGLADWAFGLELGAALAVVIGLALGTAGQCGDLAESLLKRQVGVKDSGRLIPGHGGMLDRVDALLFAFPLGWIVAYLIDHNLR